MTKVDATISDVTGQQRRENANRKSKNINRTKMVSKENHRSAETRLRHIEIVERGRGSRGKRARCNINRKIGGCIRPRQMEAGIQRSANHGGRC